MRILGISCYFHDAAAALIEDGALVAAVEEERFSRKKHDYGFPGNAIRFCLERGATSGPDLDYVVFFEKPFLKFDRLLQTTLQGFPKTAGLFSQSMRSWLLDKLWIKDLIRREVGVESSRILFSDHHLSHAASAYYCSPFEEAAVLTLDGVGEWTTGAIGVGRHNQLTLTRELRFPHSVGLLYSVFTAFLGFEVNEGEYKVMGMAPYGRPNYVDRIWSILHRHDDGSFQIDPSFFAYHYSTKRSYSNKFLGLFGQPRDPKVMFVTESTGYPSYYGERPKNYQEICRYNQYYADLAASIQAVTEELIIGIANELHRETGLTNLCMAGGVALNSVANGRILRETPFTNLYVQPSAGDGGAALGAALVAWHCLLDQPGRLVMDHAYWGPDFSLDQISAALQAAGSHATLIEDTQVLADATVQDLLQGKVVGWFQGRSEWGPRALGNRSILADPRRPETKDLVNAKIKFREPFRPFAPSVLAEQSANYFDFPGAASSLPARFMLLVVPVHEAKREMIPSVSHAGTARIQTVFRETNPLFHNLVRTFGDATGIPLVLNTSFNVKGEPMVNSPADALRTFHNSGIDTLVLGNFILTK